MSRAGAGALLALLAACQATSNRPPYDAFPDAAAAEVELGLAAATRVLAEALRADSLPVARLEERDGFLDTGWFDAATLAPTGRMPVGPGVVRIRAWAVPAKAGFSELQVETVYRPLADPSRPERDLDRVVPADHPVQQRVTAILGRLLEKYGDPAARPPAPVPAARPDTGGASRDTTARRDSTPERPGPPAGSIRTP